MHHSSKAYNNGKWKCMHFMFITTTNASIVAYQIRKSKFLASCIEIQAWLINCFMMYILFLHEHLLAPWGPDEIDAILQTTVAQAFSWMKMYWFQLKFHWSLFSRVQLPTFQHWFRSWLGVDQATSHYLNHWWFYYWCIYASLGLNELSSNSYLAGAMHSQLSLANKITFG